MVFKSIYCLLFLKNLLACTNQSIFLSGHNGLLGSVLKKDLESKKHEILTSSHKELDLTRQADVEAWMEKNKPDYVVLAAAKIGGRTFCKEHPVDILSDNMAIQNNVINSAFKFNVKKLIFISSSLVSLSKTLSIDDLESSEKKEYILAKLCAMNVCTAYQKQYGSQFISVCPTNIYGPNDNFNLENGHFFATLLHKMHKAKEEKREELIIHGTGDETIDLIFSEDVADAISLLLTLNAYDFSFINIGSGELITVRVISNLLKGTVQYKGEIVFDQIVFGKEQPINLDISKLTSLGWKPKTSLEEGIKKTYQWFLDNQETLRK